MSGPRKRFGQNFLVDAGIIDRIVRAVDARPGNQVIEIGPGHGAITEALIQSGCDLKLIEIDRDLATELAYRFPDVNLIIEDVMKVDFSSIFPKGPIRVVGNLPYNISTPLLFKLFNYGPLLTDMHFMLQLEVVDRMIAESSTRAYGRLSVMSQLFCDGEKLFEVPPESFSPRPKVRSAIIRLNPTESPLQTDRRTLEQLLIKAFSARRKTIRNAFKPLLSEQDLELLGLNPQLRPENLTTADFAACANLIARRPS